MKLDELLPSLVLPAVGALMVVTASIIHLRLPDPHETRAVRMDASRLVRRLRSLRVQRPPDANEFSDVLPESLSLGEVLARLEAAGRLAKVDTISVDAGSGPDETAGASSAGGEGEGSEAVSLADRVGCRVRISASFASLTRFLGLVEAGRPLMRVVSLEVEPEAGGVRATLELVAFYYSGRKRREARAEEERG